MTPAIIYPLQPWSGATTGVSSGLSTLYPLSALRDQVNTTNVMRASAPGTFKFYVSPAASLSVQGVALVNHNMGPSDTYRIQVQHKTTTTTTLADSGTLNFPAQSLRADGNPRFATTTPFIFNTAITTTWNLIQITCVTASVIGQVGAIAAGPLLQWDGINAGMTFGLDSTQTNVQLAGGASIVPDEMTMRQVSGQMGGMKLAATYPFLDFQAQTDLGTQFVFIQDTSTPSSWARACFLATSVKTDPLKGVSPGYDAWSFTFNEYVL